MDQLGTDFNATGSVMTPAQRQEQRRKRGECVTCGQKCFQKRLFKMVPITDHGKVLNGRCLNCLPLDTADSNGGAIPAVSRPATEADMQRFRLKQEQLNMSSRNASASSASSVQSVGGRSTSSNSLSLPRAAAPNIGTRAASSLSVFTASSSNHSGRLSTRSAPPAGRNLTSNASVASNESSGSYGTSRSGERDTPSSSRGPEQPPADYGSSSPVSVSTRRSHRSLPAHTNSGHRSSSRDSLDVSRGENRFQTNSHRRPSNPELSGHRDEVRRRPSNADFMPEAPVGPGPEQTYHREMYSRDHAHGNHAAAGENLQTEIERIIGHQMDEEEAYALMASGMSPSDILDDMRRKYQESARDPSVRSFEDPTFEANRHGVLNRGGAISFPDRGDDTSVASSSIAQNYVSAHSAHSAYSNHSDGSLHEEAMRMHGLAPRGHSSFQSTGALYRDVSGGGREGSFRSVQSENYHGSERGRAPRRFSNSSTHSALSFQGFPGGLDDHISRHSRSSEMDDSAHGDAYSTGGLSRTGYHRNKVIRRSSGDGSVARDDTEVGLDRLEDAGPDYLEIIRIMRDYPGSAEVQLNCMEELSNFDFAENDYDTLLEMGAMEVIADAMQAFPQDMVLQMSGCRAMCNTSGTPETQVCYAEFGAVDLALDAMGLFLEDARMQEQGLAALANLAATPDNIPELIDKGCLPQAVAAMNKYPGDLEVQLKGCSVITNLSSHALDVRGAIMESSGGGAVILAMVLHSQEPEVQEKALRALRNLSANNDDIKVELAHMGGIDAVVQAMRVHRDVSTVQEAGASTLCSLAANPDNKLMIGQCGGVDVTIRAMWVHSDTVSTVEWCCRALYSLSLNNENRMTILEVGGITAAVNAMQAHSESSVVQEMGCAILCSLATNDESAKEKIVAEEALDAIVLAMVLFSEDVGVQEQACHVLLQLANEANLRSMHASNVGELARSAAQRFPDRCVGPATELTQVLDGLTADYNSNNAAIAAS